MQVNSRKDGVLVFKTNTPYKIAVNGQEQERSILICKDVTYQAERYAYDLEQYFTVAILDIQERTKKDNQLPDDKLKKETEDFYTKENPTNEEIEQQAMGLETIIRMNKAIKISDIVSTFEGIVDCGLIQSDTGTIFNIYLWRNINRIDKLRIVMSYCAFFVNPLQRLSTMGTSMEQSKSLKATAEKKMQ